MVKSRYIGDGRPPTFNRNPYNGYIHPYNWVDEFIPYYMEIMGVDRPWHICNNVLGHKNPLSPAIIPTSEKNRVYIFLARGLYHETQLQQQRISGPKKVVRAASPEFLRPLNPTATKKQVYQRNVRSIWPNYNISSASISMK